METIDNDERQNQPSASSFARYQICPGSWQLEQKARELGQLADQVGKDADRGTRIHSFLAGENTETLAEEEFNCATQLQDRANEQIRRLFGDSEYHTLKESRVWLKA